MGERRQFAANTLASFLNIVIQFSVNFFLTSYLVESVGATAYGFFNLANTIVSYTLIVSTALNSMSARFVGMEYHNNRFAEASKYFSSILWGDIFFVISLILPGLVLIGGLEGYINIPPALVSQVKVLFIIVFFNMCINVGGAVFSGVYIIRNRLDLQSMVQIMGNIFRATMLVAMYVFLAPSIVYLGIAALLSTVLVLVLNYRHNKKLMPEIEATFKNAKWSSAKTVILAGMWNSFGQLSLLIPPGFNLLISNLWISPEAMGYLSVSATMPGAVMTCVSSMSVVFNPKILEYYSKNDIVALIAEVRNSVKFITIITCIPFFFLVGFGESFYQLWVPSTNVHMVYLLSVWSVGSLLTGASIMSLNYLNLVTNKMKWVSITLFINCLVNIVVIVFLLKFTNLGVYAIVATSAIVGFIRNIVFNAPYGAWCVKQRLTLFMPDMLLSASILIVGSAICFFVNKFIPTDTWISLIFTGGITTVSLTSVFAWLILNKSQRQFLLSKLHFSRHE